MLQKAKASDFDKIAKRFTDICSPQTFAAEVSFAAQLINNNVMLQKTTMESRLAAVLNVANCGLTLNPVLGFAHLVPRYNSATKQTDCTLVPDYKGLVNLALKSGIISISAYPVFKGDTFNVFYGTSPRIEHSPAFESTEIVKCYAVAFLDNGTTQFEVMTIEQLHRIRDRSESYKAYKAKKLNEKFVIWLTDEGEMCKKTVIKRLCKLLPKDRPEYQNLANAFEVDNTDYIPPITANKIHELNGLVQMLPETVVHSAGTSKADLQETILAIQETNDWDEYRSIRKTLMTLAEQNRSDFREGTSEETGITRLQNRIDEHIAYDDSKEAMKGDLFTKKETT